MLIVNILTDKGDIVHTLVADATLQEAARALDERRVGAIVVVNQKGELAGVLSERDIVREIARRGPEALSNPISTCMTRAVITAEPSETIDDCLGRMTDRRVRHLPVVVEGRLVGIISIGDLVKRKIEEAQAESDAMQRYIAAN